MIKDNQISWLKEFLHEHCETEIDHQNADDIADTFDKLWRVAKTAEKNPYPRSPRLKEALAAVTVAHGHLQSWPYMKD